MCDLILDTLFLITSSRLDHITSHTVRHHISTNPPRSHSAIFAKYNSASPARYSFAIFLMVKLAERMPGVGTMYYVKNNLKWSPAFTTGQSSK